MLDYRKTLYASLHGTNETVITNIIKYLNQIFAVDTLSVLLFVLRLNFLSFLLRKLEGCSSDKNRNQTLTHNVFVDNVKLYASFFNILKKPSNHVFKENWDEIRS